MTANATNSITLALEAVECSNRCRHCETSYGPRRRNLTRDEIRSWADRIRVEAERLGITLELGLNNSELLDHPQWREILADLGDEHLGPAFATNGHQIASSPSLVDELKERGVKWLQLTLGGGSSETHDAFTRRRGSFEDILRAAEAAQAAGMHVAWVYVAYCPLNEIIRMSELAKSISGACHREQYEAKGGVDQCVFLVKPQGAGVKMEHLRPRQADLDDLPEVFRGRFSRWNGAGCETEGQLVTALCDDGRRVGCLEQELQGGMSYCVVCRSGDVYPYCHERHPAHLLGNLARDGLETVVERLHGAHPPAAIAIRRRGLAELAAAYGDRSSDKLHSGCSLCRTLVRHALVAEGYVT
jgi:MoaA/NifB/PqqE/SkfB family radical SAM enzyme